VTTSQADALYVKNQPIVEAKRVSKWYSNVVAVSDVSFRIDRGITGLLGPNGAGKTTLLHMIAGLASTSDGELTLLGEGVRDNPRLYRRLGFMSEHEAVYGFYTGRQFVEFSAKMYGLDPLASAVDRAIDAVGLEQAQYRRVGGYSRGMKQRIRLAATLVHDPEVLLLDEPLNGTDPRQRIEFHDLMRKMAADGRTIVVSSHILEEVETLADRILLMVSGKLAAAGDFRAIRAKLDERPYNLRIVVNDPRAMASALVQMDEVDSVTVEPTGALVLLTRKVNVLRRAIPRLANERGIRLLRVEPMDESLESVFSYVVDNG